MEKYEISFLSQDRVPNPEKPNMDWQKGFAVTFQKEGAYWGPRELDTNSFVIIRCPMTEDQARKVCDGWNRQTAYEITEFVPDTDFFKVKIFSKPETVSISGVGALTIPILSDFLTKWGAVVKAEESADNSIVFTLSAMDALNGQGLIYFGDEDEYVTFTEEAYDIPTGVHKIFMDYTNSRIVGGKDLTDYLTSCGAVVVTDDFRAGKAVFTITRDVMKTKLEEAVRTNFDLPVSFRDYYLKPEYVEELKALAPIVELPDFDTLLSKMNSKLRE